MKKVNLLKEVKEIKNQLSYSQNTGVFLGAGASCSQGLPSIADLTVSVENALTGSDSDSFKKIKDELISRDFAPNIEDILNQVRLIREITGEEADREYSGVSGQSARALDIAICEMIHKLISEKEEVADLTTTTKLLAWFNKQKHAFSKEIYTTNYDVLLERSAEVVQIPYFDGFVGAYEPFFWEESVERSPDANDLTKNWIRLWKLHGSLGWAWEKGPKNTTRIIRAGKNSQVAEELVIYPSREKYDSSRKQPFIAYFDRFKRYLLEGELLFIVAGYSFSDQHVNDLIFGCLRQNPRLTLLVFSYDEKSLDVLKEVANSHLNLSAFFPHKAIINGMVGEWEVSKDELDSETRPELFWNPEEGRLILGDFPKLVEFLVSISQQG